MSSVIKELCGGAEWSEKDLRKDTAARSRVEQRYNMLKECLEPNGIEILKKLMKSEYDLRQLENIRFFINGFRLGISVNSEK